MSIFLNGGTLNAVKFYRCIAFLRAYILSFFPKYNLLDFFNPAGFLLGARMTFPSLRTGSSPGSPAIPFWFQISNLMAKTLF